MVFGARAFAPGELKKFILLGLLFALIVGTYWFLRPIKDGVFITLIGADYLPYAQLVSLVAIVPILSIYSKLVDWLPRHHLFYVLSVFFSTLLLGFTYLLSGALQAPSCGISFWGCSLGLAFYTFVKIFGSVMVALFWAFVADITTPGAAKRGYGIIVAIGQLGNIFASLFVNYYAVSLGASALSLYSVGAILLIVPLVYYFVRTTPKEFLAGFQGHLVGNAEPKKQGAGMMAGLRLMLSQPYLMAIFSTIAIYEIVQAVFDFRFKMLAGAVYQGDQLIEFLGKFGLYTGVLALVMLLFGVDRIAKKFGITTALVFFPLCLLALIGINVYPNLQLAMWVMVATRGLNYALNQPTKEQLYIATTKETKYKAKAWIEVFGTRTTEAVAQGVNMFKSMFGHQFVFFSSTIALGFAGIWIFVALYLGRTYSKAVEQDEFVC